MGEQKDELECSEAVSPGALVGPLFKVISLARQLLLFAVLFPQFPGSLLINLPQNHRF